MTYVIVLPEGGVYGFRLTHRNDAASCIATWAVYGGDMRYQVALEQDLTGQLHWHCTCADAVYRERECKHVRYVRWARRIHEYATAPVP